MANFFEKLYEKLKEAASKSSASSSDSGPGPYTSSAGSQSKNTNTSTYSNVKKQDVKAYNNAFTSSQKNYTTAKKAQSQTLQKAYNKAFTSTGKNYSTAKTGDVRGTTYEKPQGTIDLKTLGSKIENAYNNSTYKKMTDVASNIGNSIRQTLEKATGLDKVDISGKAVVRDVSKGLEAALGYLEENNQMTDVQKHHQDALFDGYIDTDSVYEKVKIDKSYADKLVDAEGNIVDYTDQIDKLKGEIESTGNPYVRKELNKQLDQLNEYVKDQKKLQYSAYYDHLINNGASEEDLQAYKKAVIEDNYGDAMKVLANFTSTVQSYMANKVKGTETLVKLAASFYGEDYNYSPYVDKIIDDAEYLRQLSFEGATGMRKLMMELYDNSSSFLYDYMSAGFFLGVPSIGATEAEKTLFSQSTLLMSDLGVLGSKIKECTEQGYDFATSCKCAFAAAFTNHLTESIGGESVMNILTGNIGADITESIFGYAVTALANSYGSEFVEEGMEAVAEPIYENIILNKGMTVEQYLNQVLSKDTLYQMHMGGLSGLVLGLVSTGSAVTNYKSKYQAILDSINIGSTKDCNVAENFRAELDEMIAKSEATKNRSDVDNEQLISAKMVRNAFLEKVQEYRENHPYMDAIKKPGDTENIVMPSDAKESGLESIAPDYGNRLAQIQLVKEDVDENDRRATELLQAEIVNAELDKAMQIEEETAADSLKITDKNDPAFYSYDNLSGIKPREIETYEPASSKFPDVKKAVWNNLKEDKTISNDVTKESFVVNSKSLTNSRIWTPGGYTALENIGSIFKTAIPINSTENINQNSGRYGNKYTFFYNEFSDGENVYLVRITTENEAPNNRHFRPNLHKVKSIDIAPIESLENKNELTPQASDTSRGRLTPTYSIDDLVNDINSVEKWRTDLSDDIFRKLNGTEQKVYDEKDLDYKKLASNEDEADTIENQIRNSMSMKDAKRMIEKAYNISLKDWYGGVSFDKFLEEVGTESAVEQLSEQIMEGSDGDLYFQYVVPIEGIMNEDFTIDDVIDAYFKGELKDDSGRKKLGDIEYGKGAKLESTFYSPKEIENAKATWDLASQKITDSNRKEVTQARADAVVFAHSEQAPEILGMSQAEINKKVKQWSNYSSKARQISNDLNKNVPREYQWVGLENSNLLSRSTITKEQIQEMVKDVFGFAEQYNPKEIADAMLAFDGDINYKDLVIEYLTWQGSQELRQKRHALGTYDHFDTKIDIGSGGAGTVYHELGHFIDNLWARELSNHVYGNRRNRYLSEMVYDDETFRSLKFDNESMKTFVSNYKSFIDNLTAKSDIRSDYTMDRKEVFARFCDYFVEWTDKTAGGWAADYKSPYNDNFTPQDCYDFVKLMQQKNALNATVLNNDAKGALWAEYGMDRFIDDKSIEDLNDEARKELRSISDKGRRVNLREDIDAAINDIIRHGDITQETYDALRESVIDSTLTKIPNEYYEIGTDIRKNILGSNFLSKENWDVDMQEINDKYHIFDESTFPTNYSDAREMLNNYFASLGDKYIYASPVQQGMMSEEDYNQMIDEKLDQVIDMLKQNVTGEDINTSEVTNDIAEVLGQDASKYIDQMMLQDALGNVDNVREMKTRLYNEEVMKLAEQAGREDLKQLIEEGNEMQAAIEAAAEGGFTPEALDQLENDMLSNLTIDDAKEQTSVLKEVKKDTKKPLRSWKDKGIFYQLRQKIFDKGIAIRDLKNKTLSASYDMYLSANSRANFALQNGYYDSNGKKVAPSLREVSKMIPEGMKNDFDYYMYHKHNIDAAKVGKPVFFNFDQAMSERIVDQYEKAHPEFMEVAQQYYDINSYLLNRQVESGVITRDTAELWKKMYPHYVPTKRVLGEVADENIIETADPMVESANKGTLYERTGGNSPIQPLDYAMAEHTKQIFRSSLFNNMARDYVRASHATATLFNEDHSYDENIIEGREDQLTAADENTPATLIWYDAGDRKIVEIPKEIYDALGPSQTPFDLPSSVPIVSWLSSMRRNLITGANPVFWATNGIKDLQDIAFNSKYAKDTYGNLIRAYKEILSGGEIAQLYRSLGGEYSTWRSEEGVDQNEHGKFYNATIGNFVKFNDIVEMAPRLAEFMSSLDHGDSLETAMYNAAEVTTNFKRGGDYAKWLNRNGWTFLNASIQGFDKQIRNISDAYDSKGWKGIASYMVKSNLIAGVPLIILNGLLHKDDKDYEQLSDYIKDNYYILWKYDDGKFVRIPKGRIANAYQGILTSLYENGVELLGDDTATEKAKKIWENTLDSLYNVWEQVGINDPLNNNLFSPIKQVMDNEAWYGDPIVSTYMQKKDPADQYDESTDIFSVWLGQKTNLSPKKINYLIDQYSGGAGDVILPMLTPKAETGLDDGTLIGGITSAAVSPFADKFTTDSVFKNQYVTDFFALDEELTALAAKENATDEAKLASKYINQIQKKMNEYYAEKRQIYNNSELSDSVKYDLARQAQQKIDDLAKLGLDTYDQIDMNGYYADLGGVSYYKNNDGEWTKSSASKEELLDGFSAQEKSDYYYMKNNITSLRDQVKADTPEGQDADYRKVTIDAIQNSNASAKMKNVVYDSYYSGKITDNINSMKVSDESKLAMKIANATATSLKDSDGKTVSNSKALYIANAYAKAGVLNDVYKYIADNNLEPSDFGLTKTVYKYSYEKLSSEYQKMYGQKFGSNTNSGDLGNVSYKPSNRSSGSGKSSSRSKTSDSGGSAMTKQEKSEMKSVIKAMQKYMKTFQTKDVDLFDVLKNSTSVADAKKNVEKILRNAKKGQA